MSASHRSTEGLEKLYQDKQSQGLRFLGFPASNFLAQHRFQMLKFKNSALLNYQVDCPLFSKISVAGDDKHPLYEALTQSVPERIGEGPWWKDLVDLRFNTE